MLASDLPTIVARGWMLRNGLRLVEDQTFLILLIIACVIALVVYVIRKLTAESRDAHEQTKNELNWRYENSNMTLLEYHRLLDKLKHRR
jgi:cell division protein FtsL